MSATVTGSPLKVVTSVTAPPSLVNTIGKVAVVPVGISWAKLIIDNKEEFSLYE